MHVLVEGYLRLHLPFCVVQIALIRAPATQQQQQQYIHTYMCICCMSISHHAHQQIS